MHDESGYQQRCAAMIERYRDSRDPDVLFYTAWTNAVAPGAVASYETPLLLAKRAVELRPQDGALQQSLGAVYYRAGRFAEAKTHLTAATKLPEVISISVAYAWYFLAMTNQRLGQTEQAKSWLDKAAAYTTKALADGKTESGEPLSWNRRLTLELLRAEATALFREAPAESPQRPDDPEPAAPN